MLCKILQLAMRSSENGVFSYFVSRLWCETASNLEQIAWCTARTSQGRGSHLITRRHLNTYTMGPNLSLSLAALCRNAIICFPVAARLWFEWGRLQSVCTVGWSSGKGCESHYCACLPVTSRLLYFAPLFPVLVLLLSTRSSRSSSLELWIMKIFLMRIQYTHKFVTRVIITSNVTDETNVL